MNPIPSSLNWSVGWWLLLTGFVSGAIIGVGFHRPDFLGGYDSFRRRLVRLGHIACCALGVLNLIVALGPSASRAASMCFVIGGVLMPVVCWLTAWRTGWRRLFFLPVLALIAAVVMTLFPRAVVGAKRRIDP